MSLGVISHRVDIGFLDFFSDFIFTRNFFSSPFPVNQFKRLFLSYNSIHNIYHLHITSFQQAIHRLFKTKMAAPPLVDIGDEVIDLVPVDDSRDLASAQGH